METMDPITLILTLALKNPQLTNDAINAYNQPGQVDASQLQSSVADFAMETLACYHKTARFRDVDIVQAPWSGQSKFGADNSVVLRITLAGMSGQPYQMLVAAMAKENSYRTFVIQENTLIPYNKNCTLERWTSVNTESQISN